MTSLVAIKRPTIRRSSLFWCDYYESSRRLRI